MSGVKKMRLIDADKLENEIVFNKLPHSVWELDAILTSCVSSQDTVEAIPIEWIKKFRNQFEPGDDDYKLIDGLLNIWRIENGSN